MATREGTWGYRERFGDRFGRTYFRRFAPGVVSSVGVGTYLGDATDPVVTHDPPSSTETDRREQPAQTADDLEPETLDASDRLHLTSQRPATAVALAQRAAEAGCAVSFDPGRRLAEREYEPVLAEVDLVFLNQREADIAADAGLLSGVDRVVVKHGAGGAEVRTDDETISHPGFAVDPVDTTGAGDAFAAGFLAASQSGSDEYALAVGNACGALAARTTGARLHAEWRDVEALLDIGPEE